MAEFQDDDNCQEAIDVGLAGVIRAVLDSKSVPVFAFRKELL